MVASLMQSPALRKNVHQELINTWFLKPMKTSTAMKIGSLNEPAIMKKLEIFFERCMELCVDDIFTANRCITTGETRWTINAVTQIGLVARKDRLDLADSPDGILSLSLSSEADSSPEVSVIIAALEMKTLAVDRTEREARARVQNIPPNQRVISAEFDSDLCRKLIWTPEYRGQVRN